MLVLDSVVVGSVFAGVALALMAGDFTGWSTTINKGDYDD